MEADKGVTVVAATRLSDSYNNLLLGSIKSCYVCVCVYSDNVNIAGGMSWR